MKTIEQIKDEVAKEHSSSSWEDMMFKYGGVGDTIIDKVVHRYAREVAHASLEKAADNAKIEKEYSIRYQDFIPDSVDKESITNPKNITLL